MLAGEAKLASGEHTNRLTTYKVSSVLLFEVSLLMSIRWRLSCHLLVEATSA